MKIYIELGLCQGDTMLEEVKKGNYDYYFGFEPEVINFHEANKKLCEYQNVYIFRQAAYTYDGEIKLYISDNEEGHSVCSNKNNVGKEYRTVQCFDFPKWIQLFSGNQIKVRMNIEGAEYAIMSEALNKMDNVEWEILYHKHKLVKK